MTVKKAFVNLIVEFMEYGGLFMYIAFLLFCCIGPTAFVIIAVMQIGKGG